MQFVVVMFLSIFIALIYEICFRLYPAYKKMQIAISLSVLATAIRELNLAFLNKKIVKDQHQLLHDRLYKFFFYILTNKIHLKYSLLRHLKYDEECDREWRKLRSELETLDPALRDQIENAIFAISKILLFREPSIFLLVICKVNIERNQFYLKKPNQYIKEKMIASAEYITATAKESDYSFSAAY